MSSDTSLIQYIKNINDLVLKFVCAFNFNVPIGGVAVLCFNIFSPFICFLFFIIILLFCVAYPKDSFVLIIFLFLYSMLCS